MEEPEPRKGRRESQDLSAFSGLENPASGCAGPRGGGARGRGAGDDLRPERGPPTAAQRGVWAPAGAHTRTWRRSKPLAHALRAAAAPAPCARAAHRSGSGDGHELYRALRGSQGDDPLEDELLWCAAGREGCTGRSGTAAAAGQRQRHGAVHAHRPPLAMSPPGTHRAHGRMPTRRLHTPDPIRREGDYVTTQKEFIQRRQQEALLDRLERRIGASMRGHMRGQSAAGGALAAQL
jgi:hypothetical protein